MVRSSQTRLQNALRQSEEMLKPFREARKDFWTEYAGPYYGRGTSDGPGSATGPEPLNSLHSTVAVVVPNIAFRIPKAMTTTERLMLRPTADLIALGLDHLFHEIDFGVSLRSVVTDSLFGPAVMKVGLGPGRQIPEFAEPEGYLHDVGQPFADPVDLDDYCVDHLARRREEAAFEGNTYLLPKQYAHDSGLFRKKGLDAIDTWNRTQGQGSDRERVSELSQRKATPGDADTGWFDYIQFRDLWIPSRNAILTLPGNLEMEPYPVLREAEWEGPERGPYEMLSYFPVPSNIPPAVLIGVLYDLHVMLNKLARKAGRQADRLKSMVIYDKRDEKDAEAVREGSDGEMVGVQNTDHFKEITFGGVRDEAYEQLDWLERHISQAGGNTDLLGGVRAESKTLGQDEMLMTSATLRINDMRVQARMFVARVVEKLAWYLWTDPLIDLPLVKRLEGGAEVPVRLTPEMMEGDFLDYNFSIQPYSSRPDDPDQMLRRTLQWTGDVVIPLAALAAQSGKAVDVEKVVAETGKLLEVPWADEAFVAAEINPAEMPIMPAVGGGGSQTTNVSLGGQRRAAPKAPSGEAQPREREVVQESTPT